VLPIIIKRGRRLFSLLNCNRLVLKPQTPAPQTPASLPARLDCCKFFSAVWTPLRSLPLPGGNLQPICFSERDMGPEGFEPSIGKQIIKLHPGNFPASKLCSGLPGRSNLLCPLGLFLPLVFSWTTFY